MTDDHTEAAPNAGVPIVIAGPSGVGKGTVVSKIIAGRSDFARSKSATTRPPRECDPNDSRYVFMSREAFMEALAKGDVIEYTVYAGNYYGTLCSQIDSCTREGKNVLLEIDVNGAVQIRRMYPDAILIWMLPRDFPELEKRLRDRGTEDEESIVRRLSEVKREIAHFYDFDYIVVNRDGKPDEAVRDILGIVESEKLRVERNRGYYENFLKSINI